jgi:hypothetical protein
MAGAWLDGATLYRDIVDTNPPLIVFLTAIPVSIARALGLPEPAVFKAFVFAVGGMSTAASIPSIRRMTAIEPSRFVLFTVLVFVLFPFVKSDFGQREHLAVMLVMPYVLGTASWAAGRSPAPHAVSGIAAGLGFAMKPHLLLAWIALEICAAIARPRSERWLRAARIAAAAALIAYAAAVVLFVPEYLPVAREVVQVYGGLNSPPALLLRLPDVQIWIVAAIALAVIRLPAAERAVCGVLFATATGFLVAALLQLKGWSYHLYPFRAFAVLLCGAFVVGLSDSYPALLEIVRGGRRSLTAAFVAAVTIWSARYVAEARRPLAAEMVTPLVELARQSDSLGALTMRAIVYPAFPAVNYAGTRWVLRHHSLWFLPGLYEDELMKPTGEPVFRSVERMSSLERKYFDEIVSDLCARPPGLLLVEPPIPRAPIGRRSLDLLAYYRQDARFDRLFASYSPNGSVSSFTAYSRVGPASCSR